MHLIQDTLKVATSQLALRDTDTDRSLSWTVFETLSLIVSKSRPLPAHAQRRHVVPLEGRQRSNCSLNGRSNEQLYVCCDKSRSKCRSAVNTHAWGLSHTRPPVIDVLLLFSLMPWDTFSGCCRKYSTRKHCSVRLDFIVKRLMSLELRHFYPNTSVRENVCNMSKKRSLKCRVFWIFKKSWKRKNVTT